MTLTNYLTLASIPAFLALLTAVLCLPEIIDCWRAKITRDGHP